MSSICFAHRFTSSLNHLKLYETGSMGLHGSLLGWFIWNPTRPYLLFPRHVWERRMVDRSRYSYPHASARLLTSPHYHKICDFDTGIMRSCKVRITIYICSNLIRVSRILYSIKVMVISSRLWDTVLATWICLELTQKPLTYNVQNLRLMSSRGRRWMPQQMSLSRRSHWSIRVSADSAFFMARNEERPSYVLWFSCFVPWLNTPNSRLLPASLKLVHEIISNYSCRLLSHSSLFYDLCYLNQMDNWSLLRVLHLPIVWSNKPKNETVVHVQNKLHVQPPRSQDRAANPKCLVRERTCLFVVTA